MTLTARELDFELRCRKEYERRTGKVFDPVEAAKNPGLAKEIIASVQMARFEEEIDAHRRWSRDD